jgi:predicted amidophosphoribosyltransferase
VLECLERTHAVAKAATSKPSERPKARAHFDSLAVAEPLALPNQVTLVDDVVTRGAQLFGAA